MRRSHLFVFITLLLTAMSFTGSAFGDSMTFNSVGGNNSGGVYTYPYNFTVNTTTMQLLCDTFDNEIFFGETWTANESSIPGGSGLFGSTSSASYEAAGLIFDAILNINGGALNGTIGNTNDANWAIWAIFSPTAYNDINSGNSSSPFGNGGNSNALSIYNTAFADVSGAQASNFSGLTVYTPVAGTQSGDHGTPQEFLGYTPVPEPGALSLLATMVLFGLGGFAFHSVIPAGNVRQK